MPGVTWKTGITSRAGRTNNSCLVGITNSVSTTSSNDPVISRATKASGVNTLATKDDDMDASVGVFLFKIYGPVGTKRSQRLTTGLTLMILIA